MRNSYVWRDRNDFHRLCVDPGESYCFGIGIMRRGIAACGLRRVAFELRSHNAVGGCLCFLGSLMQTMTGAYSFEDEGRKESSTLYREILARDLSSLSWYVDDTTIDGI